jgi:hypothetical protein
LLCGPACCCCIPLLYLLFLRVVPVQLAGRECPVLLADVGVDHIVVRSLALRPSLFLSLACSTSGRYSSTGSLKDLKQFVPSLSWAGYPSFFARAVSLAFVAPSLVPPSSRRFASPEQATRVSDQPGRGENRHCHPERTPSGMHAPRSGRIDKESDVMDVYLFLVSHPRTSSRVIRFDSGCRA